MQLSLAATFLFATISSTVLVLATPVPVPRFGQEQSIQQLINGFSLAQTGKTPGCENGSIGGPGVSTLLAAADPCKVIGVAQKVIDCGGQINDARKVLTLEKNFNPFVAHGASVCRDAALPANPQLRGILPKVDPSLPGAAAYMAKAQQRNNDIIAGRVDGAQVSQGKSIADQMVELGFTAIQGIDANAAANNNNNNAATTTTTTASTATTSTAAATNIQCDCSASLSIVNQLQTQIDQLKAALQGTGTTGSTSLTAPSPTCSSSTSITTTTNDNNSSGNGNGAGNLQKFTGSIGGAPPPVINNGSNRPFEVNGSTFVNLKAALQRSCDVQHNKCANALNSQHQNISPCEQQRNDCVNAN